MTELPRISFAANQYTSEASVNFFPQKKLKFNFIQFSNPKYVGIFIFSKIELKINVGFLARFARVI